MCWYGGFLFVKESASVLARFNLHGSKGTGLKMLAQTLGIQPEKTIAVGDNENDISMIKEAQVGIAVGNAVETVKAAADIVTVTNNESAIAKIIYDVENGTIKI